jgi:large subunit ribosomal protein L10
MATAEKSAVIAEMTENFRKSTATVMTEYRGLSVTQLKELRRALGPTTTYKVVKNTLSRLAAKAAGVEGLDEMLKGPSAIAFIEGDAVESAKGLKIILHLLLKVHTWMAKCFHQKKFFVWQILNHVKYSLRN